MNGSKKMKSNSNERSFLQLLPQHVDFATYFISLSAPYISSQATSALQTFANRVTFSLSSFVCLLLSFPDLFNWL